MRIAMLTSVHFPPEEGIGFYVLQLARELTSSGHEVTVLTRGGGSVESTHVGGIRVIGLPFWPLYPLHVQVHGAFVRRYLSRAQDRFDLVHAHTPLPPYPPHGFSLVTTVHTPMRADGRSFQVRSLRTLANRAQSVVSQATERALFQRSQAIVAVARSVAAELAEYGISPSSVRVAGNGVNASEFAPDPVGPRTNASSILYCGNLGDPKGLDDLVQAFAMIAQDHPTWTLVLAGKGPAEASLRKLAIGLGLEERVRFVGHIGYADRQTLVELYRAAGVYVQPSHHEGLPTSLLEAMSCATSCVATSVSGHLDVISPGSNGLLVPPAKPELLAEAISTLIRNRNLARALGLQARETILANYTWRSVAATYVGVYQEAIAAKTMAGVAS